MCQFVNAVKFESKETHMYIRVANQFLLPMQWTLHQQKPQGSNTALANLLLGWLRSSLLYWVQASWNQPSRTFEYQRVTCDDHNTRMYTWSLVFSWAANWLQKYRAVLWCFSSQLSILRDNISNNSMIHAYLCHSSLLFRHVGLLGSHATLYIWSM